MSCVQIQRQVFKKDRKNKGKVYDGGLFSLSRHINYFGYTLWRTGYALAAGGWTWGAVTASFFVYDFNFRAIPVLQHYLEENVSRCANDYLNDDAFTDNSQYGPEYEQYKQAVPYKFVPFIY